MTKDCGPDCDKPVSSVWFVMAIDRKGEYAGTVVLDSGVHIDSNIIPPTSLAEEDMIIHIRDLIGMLATRLGLDDSFWRAGFPFPTDEIPPEGYFNRVLTLDEIRNDEILGQFADHVLDNLQRVANAATT